MKQCRKCYSLDLTYVVDYEHLDFESEDYVKDSGWLCNECECFHMEDSFEYFIENHEKQVYQ